ncbi:MAG: ATP phosphoribosyltransferase [Prevotellaceae bacterium]|jgi:ATP phosphoribosyltransferase|nr:ATP phosphoribosyltransferase [Prevotellaceae bacterium]
MLKIAIQKSGRLSEKSLELLAEAGINVANSDRKLVAQASNFPIALLYLRDDDIPQCVYDGVADVGVVGENVLLETGYKLDVVERLGFGKCRMSLAIPKSEKYDGIAWFNGRKIATSYPKILQDFLNKNSVQASIHHISGSVEISTGVGIADAIFDIVSSGSTLISNGLKEVDVALHSEAVMVGKRAQLEQEPEKIATLEKLMFRLQAVQKGRKSKYVMLNAPAASVEKIISVIPGMKSPTVVPLAQEGWCSVHSVLPEGQIWEIIDQLHSLGAQGILVMPIEKMIL